MATFRKRGDAWRAEIVRTIDGKRIRLSETFPTKAHAQAWATEKEAELLKVRRTGLTHTIALPGQDAHTFGEALERYRNEVSPSKRGKRWEQVRIKSLLRDEADMCSIKLPKLTPEHLAAWRDARLQQVSPSTVNRELNIISAVLECARREWRWIPVNPCRDVRRPSMPRPRQQRISDDDRDAIVASLGFKNQPPTEKRQEVAIMFLLSIETGMRSGELVALQWRDIHLPKRFLTIQESKNGHKRDIPLSARAGELLKLMRGLNDDSVFKVGSAERDALFRKYRPAHLEHINYHDSRHEAVTRLAKKLDVLKLARIIGHRDLKSLMIYYNETAEEMAGDLD